MGSMSVKLPEVCDVIRSKNSGPFELTLDMIFSDFETYRRAKAARLINEELIAKLYGITPEKVLGVIYFDPAKAIKATIARALPCGSPGDTDVYGAQQHAPLLDIDVPDEIAGVRSQP